MTFVKGDPRINRKGRPKSFDQLRALAQMIASEAGAVDADGTAHSNAEMGLRKLMREDTVKFLEIAFGKVPNPIQISGPDDSPVQIQVKKYDYDNSIARIAPGSTDDTETHSED